MRGQGHDPSFRPLPDTRQARYALLDPAGHFYNPAWQVLGARAGLEVSDPTFDKRIVEFCLSIPRDRYVREGTDRWLIRRAMTDLMPP